MDIKSILEKHAKWLKVEEGGERAYLSGAHLNKADLSRANLIVADLSRANLREANLRGADLSGADLREADLREANLIVADLSRADLSRANLREANLRGADLSRANLRGADLREANLRGADLRYADLRGAIGDETTAFFAMCCPEKGAFTAFKKAGGYIVELEVLEDALRSSATSRKCRCSKAKVLGITNLDGEIAEIKSVASDRDPNFIYEVGKIVEIENFDNNRWNECSTGIHFFITRNEAVHYNG